MVKNLPLCSRGKIELTKVIPATLLAVERQKKEVVTIKISFFSENGKVVSRSNGMMEKKFSRRNTFCFPNLSIIGPMKKLIINADKPPQKNIRAISSVERLKFLDTKVLRKGNMVAPPANVRKVIKMTGITKVGFFIKAITL
jgi:hypothetical protein